MPRLQIKRKHPRSIRIVAGAWRGRRIVFPPDTDVRPTPDRARETLFNWLRERIEGASCLDLFAGSGILGLEALSRGAKEASFVERDARLAAAIAEHARMLGADGARVLNRDVNEYLRSTGDTFDLVFVDPPYAVPLEPLVDRLPAVLDADALVYFERAAADGLPRIDGIRWRKSARVGAVCFGLAQVTRSS